MDNLGDRMKVYEKMESSRRLLPLLPVCARIDGKNFSKFTRGLERPFDRRFAELMRLTTLYLVRETQANSGYTQSDEISLFWYSDDCHSQIFLDGKIQKMVSILASMTTAFFNSHKVEHLPEKANMEALFDCRVWQLPTLEEAVNTLVWRELDATRNSVSMVARSHYSHKALHQKSGNEKKTMIMQKGDNWDDYPAFLRRGTFVQRHRVSRPFTPAELDILPIKHEARSNPDLIVDRTEIRYLDTPPFPKMTNRVDVVFHGANPIHAAV
jgi:tRNA(His) guanylyltransferase